MKIPDINEGQAIFILLAPVLLSLSIAFLAVAWKVVNCG